MAQSPVNLNILLVFLLLLAGNAAYGNVQQQSSSSSTTTPTTGGSDENTSNTNSEIDSGETDVSSSNNFEMKVQSPDSKSSAESSSSQDQSSQESTAAQQQQFLQQLLQQSQPGQFMPLMNKEVAPGHVTMIGYTTPIVKVGDPIPLDQFLKQQQVHQAQAQQQHTQQQQQQLLPPSQTSQQEFAKYLTRFTQDPAPAAGLVPTNSAINKPSETYQLFLQPQPEQPAKLVSIANSDGLKPSELEKPNPQMSYDDGFNTNGNIGELPTNAAGQSILVDPQQIAKQAAGQLVQAEPQQFVQPLEKPRPFLVYKPGFKPPTTTQQVAVAPTSKPQLLQHIQIDHLQAKSVGQGPQKLITQFGDVSSENEIDQPFPAGFHPLAPPHLPSVSPQQLIKQQPAMVKPLQHHFEWEPIKQTVAPPTPAPQQVVTSQPQVTPYPSFASSHPHHQSPFAQSPLRPMMFGAVPAYQHQSPSLGQAHSSFLRSVSPTSAAAAAPSPISGSLIKTEAPIIQTEQVQGGGSSVDTRAELQNQIKHVLASSPNLSEDSRKRHREAIMKAVQSLVDTTTSNHQAGIAHLPGEPQQQTHFLTRPTAQPQQPATHQALSQFPSFHPKSMLFNYPKAAVQPQSTPVSSLLNNAHKKQFTSLLSPQDNQINNQPFSFLDKYPSLLPGLNGVTEQPGKQHLLVQSPAGQSATDQKIQSQIQHFLQQHDPQRQQVVASQSPAQHQAPPSFFASLLPQSGHNGEFQPHGHPPRFLIEDTTPMFNHHNKHSFPSAKIRLAPGLMLSSEPQSPINSGSSAQAAQVPAPPTTAKHHHHHTKPSTSTSNTHRHHHHPHHSLMSSYQPDTVSHIQPKQTMRGYSEWWKERALISDDGHTSISGAIMNSHPTSLAPFANDSPSELFSMPVAAA